jgi:predicted metalloendopeptidase
MSIKKYYFLETQKADAIKLVDNLFASFNETFTNTLWMDIPTRTEAIKKLENMSKVVGYPNWLNDSEQVYHHHESLDFASSYYFENAVNAQVFAETYGNNYQYNKEAEQLLAYRLTGSTGAHTVFRLP